MIENIIMQHLWIGMLLLLCIGACNKKKTITPIDATVKKYFSYKPGTYWIYRDSLSGQVDSFVVTNNVYTTVTGTLDYDVEGENISVYKNGSIYDSLLYGLNLHGNEIAYSYDNSISYINYYHLLVYPFLEDGSHYDPDGKFTIETLVTYNLNGNIYNNVALINRFGLNSSGVIINNYIFYINNQVGIIKMKLNHDSINNTWELLRSNIIH